VSLLDNLPHRCTIRRRTRTKGTLGGSKDSQTNEQTNVECWEQNAGHNEVMDYEKRGMSISRKVYFASDPGVTSRHEILITERNGTTISSPVALTVKSEAIPDASAGMGVLYKVMCDRVTSSEN